MHIWALVRWFSTKRGYGFVVPEDGKGDILLHVNELLAFGLPSVAEGARILVHVEATARGERVAKVLDVRPPGPQEPPPAAGPLEPARVRWFDRDRGFGFVNVYGRREDVFLHMATLREFGFGAVAEGDAILVRVTEGPNGPVVCEVRGWDYPNRPRGRRRGAHRPIVFAGGGPERTFPEQSLRTAAAILDAIRAGTRGGVPGGRRAGSRSRAAAGGPRIGARSRAGCHIDHVDLIFVPVFGVE
jgi:CspA family cold shock protein